MRDDVTDKVYAEHETNYQPDPTEPISPLEKFLRDPIQNLSPPAVICADPDATLSEVVKQMNDHKIGAVVVVEGEGLVGIFTERDLLAKVVGRKLDFDKHKIADYMTKNPECLTEHDAVAFALNKMVVGGYRHVPVVDAKRRPIGIVSMREIAEHLVDYFPDVVLNLPPEPGMAFKGRDGG